MKKLTPNEYMMINHTFITIFIVGYFIYFFSKKKCDIKCLKKLSKKDYAVLILGAITTILATLVLLYLIAETEVSYAIAHIQPVVIALTVILGYVLFNEKMSLMKISGISLILIGLIFLNNTR
jgi:uncharacterized membrane protein